MAGQIPDFSESLADVDGKPTRNWYNFWKDQASARQIYYAPTVPTRMWIDIVAGNDANDGLTADRAMQTPQAAVNRVIKFWNLNNNGVEFFYRWRDDGFGQPIEYPGVIFAYPFAGSPHDFAIQLTGETDSGGSVRVRIADGTAGCIHAAEGAQVYVSNIAVRSTTAGVPALKAAYNGKLFLTNVVIYTGGGPMLDAGPRGGSIDTLGPIFIQDFTPTSPQSTGITNAVDTGSITSAIDTVWTLVGTPSFSFGVLNVSTRGRQELRHTWAGTGAVGTKWTMQSDGMFLTGGGAGAAALNAWTPGTIAGTVLDSGGFGLIPPRWNIL